MKKLVLFPLLFLSYAVLVVCSGAVMSRENPLDNSSQLILVTAKSDTSTTATLSFFEKTGSQWTKMLSFPAVLGRSGMAWGRGLHRLENIPEGERIKKEGDGASPQGMFRIMGAWGYLHGKDVSTALSYTQSTKDLVWVDEPSSRLYNKPAKLGFLKDPPPSHEKMLRDDNIYKYVILIGHNAVKPKAGAGSAIFIHVARENRSPTAGCTALAEKDIVKLLGILDKKKKPVIVQLTDKNYDRFKVSWGLP